MADQENQWRRDLDQVKKNSSPERAAEAESEDPGEEYRTENMPEPLARDLDEDTILESSKSPQAQAARVRQEVAEKRRSFSAALLRLSWLFFPVTFGFSLLYAAFHYTMAYIARSPYFPKAGIEWIKFFTDKLPAPRKTKKWTEETYGKPIEPLELSTFCCCCGSCVTPLLLILIVVWMLANPCNSLKNLSSDLFLIAKALTICN